MLYFNLTNLCTNKFCIIAKTGRKKLTLEYNYFDKNVVRNNCSINKLN